jgi:hypothetical protein
VPSFASRIIGILAELKRLAARPGFHPDKDDPFRLPRLIWAGPGAGSIIVSRKIDDHITAIASELQKNTPALLASHTRAEWRAAVRDAFGPALARIDFAGEAATNAASILTAVKESLAEREKISSEREFGFGCTLFGNPNTQPFSIGPVTFEPRDAWLARKYKERAVTRITKRRIERAWAGAQSRKRKSPADDLGEADILRAIGASRFVCSVMVRGLAAEAAQEKSLTVARLAMAGIALLWQSPSGALNGMNLTFDLQPHLQTALTFVPGVRALSGVKRSHNPHGPRMKTGEWEQTFIDEALIFGALGEVLNFLVSPTGKIPRAKLMSALAQALLWFHEGCRETVTLMAIINFTASLDALTCGKELSGILQLIAARLGIQRDTPILADGATLKQVVTQIYGEGRSRTIHGTNDKLGHDWSEARALSEHLARICLLACLEWASVNASSDDPRQLAH